MGRDMRYVITEKIITLVIGTLYILGARYLLGLGDIETDIAAIKRFFKRQYRRFTNVLYWYSPAELFHQVRGLRIVNSLG